LNPHTTQAIQKFSHQCHKLRQISASVVFVSVSNPFWPFDMLHSQLVESSSSLLALKSFVWQEPRIADVMGRALKKHLYST